MTLDEPDRLLRGPRAVSAESHQEFPLGGFSVGAVSGFGEQIERMSGAVRRRGRPPSRPLVCQRIGNG